MFTYLFIDRIPDTWEPQSIWLLFGFELILDVFVLVMVITFLEMILC